MRNINHLSSEKVLHLRLIFVIRNFLQETFVENASTSVLTFVPRREDHGVLLKCSATNPNVKVWRKEASTKLNVLCKYFSVDYTDCLLSAVSRENC